VIHNTQKVVFRTQKVICSTQKVNSSRGGFYACTQRVMISTLKVSIREIN